MPGSSRTPRICGGIPASRHLTWPCQPDPLDRPLPLLGPNLTRLKRALWLLRSADALDRGDLAMSESLWIEACVDFICDATRHPNDASTRYPMDGRPAEANAPPSPGHRDGDE